jgi:hypothetical protein
MLPKTGNPIKAPERGYEEDYPLAPWLDPQERKIQAETPHSCLPTHLCDSLSYWKLLRNPKYIGSIR